MTFWQFAGLFAVCGVGSYVLYWFLMKQIERLEQGIDNLDLSFDVNPFDPPKKRRHQEAERIHPEDGEDADHG